MPIQTPPQLPPATPAQQAALQRIQQEQQQQQSQDGEFNNQYAPSINDESTSNSTSESQNVVSQSGSLVNLQQNNSYDSFFRYSTGTHIPAATVNLGASLLPNGQEVISANINIPLGGRSKRLAYREVELASISKEASICTGLIKANIDASKVANLSFCNDYQTTTTIAVAPTQVPASTEAATLKAQMKEQLRLLKRQQQTIEALQLRLTQIQHQPSPIKSTY